MTNLVYSKPMIKYHQKIFDYLEPLAIQSNEGWARLAAAVAYKGKIISTGVNSLKSHPFQKKWSRNSESIFLHAENNAIHKAVKNEYLSPDFTLEGYDLYVMRMKKDGPDSSFRMGLARPCEGCQRCIAEFGIRNIFYTTNEGIIDYL